MKKFLFTSSVFAAGFSAGYALSLRLTKEILTQHQKRSEGDFSFDEKSFVSNFVKFSLDEYDVKEFSESLDKLR